MNDRPTPEMDEFFRSFADGDATPSHAEYYDRMTQLERKRDEGREWKYMLSGWGGTPEIVHEFIKGQQARIHAVQDIERELTEAREEVQRIQHWATVNGTLQMHRELIEAREQRDKLAETLKELRNAEWLSLPGRAGDIIESALAAMEGDKQ